MLPDWRSCDENLLSLFNTHCMESPTHGGETDLDTLLRSMNPVLHDDVFVFATLNENQVSDRLSPVMLCREREGITVVISQATAKRESIPFTFPCRMITLSVHSGLEAVGFLARVVSCLAELHIGVNPVAGYYHDHLFVPVDRAEEAMIALRSTIARNQPN